MLQSITPCALTIRVQVDPYDDQAPMTVQASVQAVNGDVMAVQTVQLEGIESDFLDTLVTTICQAWQWGAPAQQLRPAMLTVKRAAAKHRKAHAMK